MATMLIVGFTAAPVAAAGGTGISFDGDGISIDVGDDVSVGADKDDGVNVEEDVDEGDTGPDVGTPDSDPTQVDSEDDSNEGTFPEEVCTDVTGEVHDSAPYEQVPWFDDLPEEAQPPGVPTSVITPEAVAGIVFGVTPNQCEVQDPNDPSYDPREDDVDPDADAEVVRVGEYGDGGIAIVRYGVTLNESGEGPGSSGVVTLGNTQQYGDNWAELAVNDGEKDYAVEPRVRYWDGGRTAYAENDVWLLGSRLGVNVDCDGEECQPGTGGLPHYADYPTIPAPTGEDDGGDGGGFCTDVTGQVHENAPYEQVPWFDDLPEEAQPPGVPTSVITPEAVAGIVFGVTPNQCEVQDPNDPSYDPREDDVDPDADAEVVRMGQYDDGGIVIVRYEATLNQSGEGPGSSGVVTLGNTQQYGDNWAELAVNDGEKDYAVEPRVRYWDGGRTYYAKNDVWLLGSKLGVNVDCDGEECQPGTGGLPHYADYPAFPAPTGGDGGGGDGGGGENDPTYDPREDDVEPGGNADVVRVGQYGDGGIVIVRYGVTLNESGEGPGSSGVVTLGNTQQYGDNWAELAVNDGEKDYAVEPRVRYWDGGRTYYAKNDVRLLGSRLGVNVECDGEECQPGTEGLPEFVDYPGVPAPTGGD